MASVEGGFFFPLGCKEKITVFVFLVTRVMCSHPNLLYKSFQSSFLSLGTAFDLFLTSFLCYTTSCLSLLNVLIDVVFSAWNPFVLYCSHFTYCLSYSVPQCEKYSASPCVTAYTLCHVVLSLSSCFYSSGVVGFKSRRTARTGGLLITLSSALRFRYIYWVFFYPFIL